MQWELKIKYKQYRTIMITFSSQKSFDSKIKSRFDNLLYMYIRYTV